MLRRVMVWLVFAFLACGGGQPVHVADPSESPTSWMDVSWEIEGTEVGTAEATVEEAVADATQPDGTADEVWPGDLGDAQGPPPDPGDRDPGVFDAPILDGFDVVPCSKVEDCATWVGPAPVCRDWVCQDGGCVLVPLTGGGCDDDDACTESDVCVLGECTGQPKRCDDDDPCTHDHCHPVTGCWFAFLAGLPCDDKNACTRDDTCREDGGCKGVEVSCDDGNPCTRDACDPAQGCRYEQPYGAPCDDGSVCTKGDHCEAGVCTGVWMACDDGNPCTSDSCDPLEGCRNVPADGASCNDGNPCTDLDRCVAGVCVGQATACDDGEPCTLDSCTAASGCVHKPLSGLPCDDGDACTAPDKCGPDGCRPGKPVLCDDFQDCTDDWCDPAVGCVHASLTGTACDDRDACTIHDTCVGGECRGNRLVCDDANPCTDDHCDPSSGCVFVPNSLPCDDGDPCTSGDECVDGICRAGRDPECLAVQRVVLAGDSWSAGLILPLRDALDARGYEEVVISWETTSKPGSTVAGWLADPNLMLALYAALDMEPKAGILLFTLGGNDYLRACQNGLGLMGGFEWFLTMTAIQWDLQTFVALAQAGRPHLKVVLVGYDYLNYLVIQALGHGFPGFDWVKFNLGMVDLAHRQRNVAANAPNIVYAHNMGLMQHIFGDPMFGYGPGAAPKPGQAPTYDPFPGGWFTYPSPLGHIPDGIHPDYEGFRAIIENTLDQGAAAWIEGLPWP